MVLTFGLFASNEAAALSDSCFTLMVTDLPLKRAGISPAAPLSFPVVVAGPASAAVGAGARPTARLVEAASAEAHRASRAPPAPAGCDSANHSQISLAHA